MRKTPILKLISAAFAIGSAVVAVVLFALLGQTEAVAESSFVSADTTTRRPTLTTMFPPTTTVLPTTVSPTTGVPFARTLRPGDNGPEVLALQQRLQGLGYWLGVPDGAYRARTVQAVLAFQKVAGIERSGTVELETHFALGRAIRPEAASTGGDLIEVDKARQVLFVVHRGSVEWILNVSTGTDKRYQVNGRTEMADTPPATGRSLGTTTA